MDNKEYSKLSNLILEYLLNIIDPLAGIKEEEIIEIANELALKDSSASKSVGEVLFAVLNSYHKLQQVINKRGIVDKDKDKESSHIPDFIKKRLENIG